MKKRKGKVVKYRKPIKINIGIIVFGIILFYLLFNIFFYLTKDHISVYEVSQGTIAANHTYRGLILREEEIVTSAAEGYVTYYVKEGSKAGSKTAVYSLDNNGGISSQIEEEKKSDSVFKDEDYLELEDTVQAYTGSYNSQNFYSVYSFKDEINGKIMEIQNVNALSSLKSSDMGGVQVYTPPKPGVVVYHTDGYENVTVESLTKDMFDENKYKKVSLKDQKTVGANVPVYKLITDENWNVVFKISDELAKEMKDDNTVEVLFKDDGNTIWAYYDILKIDKESYLNLKFRTSAIRFANQRFIDVELLLDNASGLKIPNTAITTKQFLTVPTTYFIRGKDSDSYGLLLLEEDGKTSFITPEIFYEKDGCYYIDESDVAKGAQIQKPDSKDTYTINKTAKLKGVYNVNKGYAVFKQIDVLYQNEEYSILKKGTNYGLSLYDHIALEGDSVSENDLIH